MLFLKIICIDFQFFKEFLSNIFITYNIRNESLAIFVPQNSECYFF